MNEQIEVLEILNSGDSDAVIDLLQKLQYSDITEETAKNVCKLLESENKGVVNSASSLLINNPHQAIPELVVKYVSSRKIVLRNLAGEILLRIGSLAIPSMVSFIDICKVHDDQKFVIDLMGLIGDKDAVEPITKLFKTSENDNVVLACIEALGNLESSEILDELLSIYDNNELYKPTLMEAIGKIGSKKGLDFIIEKYQTEDDLVKFSILESLGQIGDEETFFFLLSELNEISGALVWPLLSSIYNLKEKFGFDIPFDERMKNSILQTIYDADMKYKKIAAYLVNSFDDPDIIFACLNIYGSEDELDETIKHKFVENSKLIFSKIYEILNRMPANLKALLALLQELTDINPEVNHLLSGLEFHNLSDSISRCLEHHDEEIRQIAVGLLFKIDPQMALMFVDVMLNDDNMWNRLRLTDYLDIDLPDSIDALVKLTNDEDEMVRQSATDILKRRKVETINK